MEKMIQIAESYGWAVDMDSDSIEFNQCSPAGEDFSFTVLTKDASDAESLAAEVRSYADSFDTEEHVKMLVDAQGSVSGVPDIKTLVEDADAIQEMLNDLADALENGDANTDDEETEACGLEGTYEWLLNNFDIDGTAGRIIHNVLEYADRMTGDEQYEFLTEMLDGTIGLSDREALLRVEAAQQVRFSLVEVVLILCFSVCEHIGMIVPILFQQHGLALTKLTLGRFVIKEVVVRCADKLLHEIAGFLPVAGKSLQSGSLRQANDRRAKVSGDIHMIAVHHRTNRVRLRPWLSPVQNAHVFVQNVEACLVVCESLFSFYHFLIHFLLLLSAFSSSCVQNPGKR